MTEQLLDGIPEYVTEQSTSRSNPEPEPKPWLVSLAPPAAPEPSSKRFASVLRKHTASLSTPPAEDDVFTQPTQVSQLVPRSMIQAALPTRPRHGLWIGVMLTALIASAGVVRATDSQREAPDPAFTHVVMQTTTAPDTTLTASVPVVGDGACRLVVRANPVGSTVVVDGTELGLTPVTIAASCGTHRIDISHPTHATTTVLGSLIEGKPELVDVTLSSRLDAVSVISRPTHAMIYIDGRLVGRTPHQLNVLGHVPVTLEIRKPGYRTTFAQLNTIAARNTLTVRLARASSR